MSSCPPPPFDDFLAMLDLEDLGRFLGRAYDRHHWPVARWLTDLMAQRQRFDAISCDEPVSHRRGMRRTNDNGG